MLNYIFEKGFSLFLNRKILCELDLLELTNLKIRKIRICHSTFSLNFSISLSKMIMKNKKRLIECSLILHKTNQYKNIVVILKAISFCSNVKNLSYLMLSDPTKYYFNNSLNFFEFLNFKSKLEFLEIHNENFYDKMDFNPFSNLISLKSLGFFGCIFEAQAFINLFESMKSLKYI